MQPIDRDRFAQFVRDHHAAVYRSAARVLGAVRAGRAEDVTQAVFLAVLEGKHDPGAGEAAGKNLCWRAARLALNELRGAESRERHEQEAPMPTPTSTPDQHAADHEQQRGLRAALQRLPDELRVPLVLRFQEGLTFTAVGEALALPESTAHERVQRGLQKLKDLLARAGFAVAPVRLPQLLEAAGGVEVPAALPSTLLALRASGAATVTTPWGAFVAAVVGVAVCAVAVGGWLWRGSAPRAPVPFVAAASEAPAEELLPEERLPEEPARAAVSAGAAAAAAAPQQDPVAEAVTVAFHGAVRDAAGWPVAGARVFARSTDSAKAPSFTADAPTDEHGRFVVTLRVPARKAVQGYAFAVEHKTRWVLPDAEFDVRVGAPPDLHVLQLPAEVGTARDRWLLAVTVTDPQGLVREGLPVAVYRETEGGVRPGRARPEVKTTTDATGTAYLESTELGAKLLFVDGRTAGGCQVVRPWAVAQPGFVAEAVRLPAGGEVRGHVSLPQGSSVDSVHLWFSDDDTEVILSSKTDASGAFRCAGLDAGTYTVRVRGRELSPALLHGVRAGGAPLAFALKRWDDPRDVGDHLGEAHGVLVDAASGDRLEVTEWTVERLDLGPGDSTLLADRIDDPFVMAQRAAGMWRGEEFHVTGMAPGEHALLVQVRGYAPHVEPVRIEGREVVSGLRLALHRGAELRGVVRDAAGDPVAGAKVFVVGVGATADQRIAQWDEDMQRPRDERRYPSRLTAQVWADDDGTFSLQGVPAGVAVRVAAAQQGCRAAVSAPLTLREGAARESLVLRVLPR